MRTKRLLKTLRFILIISIGIMIGGVIGSAYYLNQSGLNEKWRHRISQELENMGLIASFDSLRLDVAKGLVAKGVEIYADKERKNLIAGLEHLVIDVDKTKLMRGIVRVNNVSLKQADISLPIDLEDPESERIIIHDLSGEVFLPDKRTINAKNILGQLAGVQLDINANVWHDDKEEEPEPPSDEKPAYIQQITNILTEIKRWQWPEKSPPLLKIYIEGNISKPESLIVNLSFKAEEIERQGALLKQVSLHGDYKNNVITLDQISFRDEAGLLNGHADYHPLLQRINFQLDSTLHLQMLVRKFFGIEIMDRMIFSTPPNIQCKGNVQFNQYGKANIQMTGKASVEDFSFLGSRFRSLKTDFSAKDTNLFLTGLQVTHPEGQITGRILIADDTIRYEADSTLPAFAYSPFIKNSNIERILSKASFSDESKVHITTKGLMNRHDLTDWEAHGSATFKNISYQETPLKNLSGDYKLRKRSASFNKIKATLNYFNYALKKTYGGPISGEVTVDSINVDDKNYIVKIDNIKGTVWPAPVVRLFVPHTANHIEQYRFHRPPTLSASGVFGTRHETKDKHHFKINVASNSAVDYTFLNKSIQLNKLKAQVNIIKQRVEVKNLSFNTFRGPLKGEIFINVSNPAQPSYKGGLQWKQIKLKDLGATYDFDNAEQGLLTGRIDFRGTNDNIRAFNATGNIALEKGNLFAVPLLGPLTRLVGAVLGDKNPSEETAENASCSYIIKNGVFYSNDFLASTRSLKFTGEGNIDLANMNINILMRMNARGVFGFILIPLRPFMGLFQFQGTGSFSNPNWNTTIFTNPPKGKNDPLFRKPPKATLVAE